MLAFIDDHPSKDLMVSKVDSFLKRAKTSEKERKLVEDFKAVFLYSNEFWSSRDTRNGSDLNYRSRCNPGDQRSFADAFGGLIGAVLGSSFPPFGSAVGGFVGSQGMSAIIRAIKNHHGGGCI